MSQLTANEWIWHDGAFVRWEDAQVHVLAHSMQFGSSAFEGVRCYSTPQGPAIFRLEDHLRRLIASCRMYEEQRGAIATARAGVAARNESPAHRA